jgi:uncharacterized cupin superfamily protein
VPCRGIRRPAIVSAHGFDGNNTRHTDLVRFPAGMSCTWEVRVPVRRHYSFE